MEVIKNSENRSTKIGMIYSLCHKCYAPLKIMPCDIKRDEQQHFYTICKCGNKVALPDSIEGRF